MSTLSRRSSKHPLLQQEDPSALTSVPDPATPSPDVTAAIIQDALPPTSTTTATSAPKASSPRPKPNGVLDSLLHNTDDSPSIFDASSPSANLLSPEEPQTLSAAPAHVLQGMIDREGGAIPVLRRLSRLLAERDAHVTALIRLAEEYKIPRERVAATTERVKRAEERRAGLKRAMCEDLLEGGAGRGQSNSGLPTKSAATTTLARLFGGTVRASRSTSRTPAPDRDRLTANDAQSIVSVQSAQTVQSTDSGGWATTLFGKSHLTRHDSRTSKEPVELITQHDKDQLPPTLVERREDPQEAAWNKFLLGVTKARSRNGKQRDHDANNIGLIGPLTNNQPKLKTLAQLIIAGIPMQLRQYIWLELSHADALMEPGAYETYRSEPVDASEIDAIVNDVPRTLTQSRNFYTNKGFPRLKEVLLAFVAKYDSLGYTQGLNSIAGYLLLAIPQNEQAFWMLCTMVEKYFPASYFARENAMTGPLADVIVLRSYVRELLPALAKHMDDLGIDAQHTVPVRWFFTAFSAVLGEDALMRVWDIWLCMPGQKSFLFNVALALLMQNLSGLMACESEGEFWAYLDDREQCKVDGDAEWVNRLIKAAVDLRKEVGRKVEERRMWEAKVLRKKSGSCEALFSPEEGGGLQETVGGEVEVAGEQEEEDQGNS